MASRIPGALSRLSMPARRRNFERFHSLFTTIVISMVILDFAVVYAIVSDTGTITSSQRKLYANQSVSGSSLSHESQEKDTAFAGRTDNLSLDQDTYIVAAYTDASGAFRKFKMNTRDLSASWVFVNPSDKDHDSRTFETMEQSSQAGIKDELQAENHLDHKKSGEAKIWFPQMSPPMSPEKQLRKISRRKRWENRTAELIRQDKEADNQKLELAVERSHTMDTSLRGKFSIWRRDNESSKSVSSILKLMRHQIIMAKAYATIAISKDENDLYNSLTKQSRESQLAIGEASSDAELHPSALDRAKTMGHTLSIAKQRLYDCSTVSRKLRTMLQSTEGNVNSLRKYSAFLMQLAAKSIPKPLHCLPLQLATDYYLLGYQDREFPNKQNFEDSSLYHYAIFSDNALATSVAINSTVTHAKEPEKHVFHVVTDKLNFPAMRMWFLVNPPKEGTVQVENIDDFKWLNSTYCSVLRQLESVRIKEFYFKANATDATENLKYRNPKYLSMLNHLRFYLPEVFPKLDKILFLDDDIVVQNDLTPLWSVDLHGKVNGAVETCKESFHRFDTYLNFSNPAISNNFDPNACGWAYGMNLFDLKEWKKQNITEKYHQWQDMNDDRTLWKLGTLPAGLVTFYNLTYPLEPTWHVLGLGYDADLNMTAIKNAAVVHYNGNNKPWLDLAITKYKSLWSRHVRYDNQYLERCNVSD